jgi:hypothetical protein
MPEPRILDKIAIDATTTVVLYDWMEIPDCRNLVLKDGDRVRWRALPPLGDEPHRDCFVAVSWDGMALTAHTFSGFSVAVDIASGAISILKFTK